MKAPNLPLKHHHERHLYFWFNKSFHFQQKKIVRLLQRAMTIFTFKFWIFCVLTIRRSPKTKSSKRKRLLCCCCYANTHGRIALQLLEQVAWIRLAFSNDYDELVVSLVFIWLWLFFQHFQVVIFRIKALESVSFFIDKQDKGLPTRYEKWRFVFSISLLRVMTQDWSWLIWSHGVEWYEEIHSIGIDWNSWTEEFIL